MKIAISGSAGTGKTALATALSERLGIPLVPEYARETAQQMGFETISRLREEGGAEAMARFQDEIARKKIGDEQKHSQFVADRSLMDHLALTLHHCARDLPEPELERLVTTCVRQAREYDIIILLPLGAIPLEVDGFRSPSKAYQLAIHCLLRGLHVEYSLAYHLLGATDLQGRVAEVLQLVDNHGRRRQSR